MNRKEMLNRIEDRNEPWDMLVIGGGATGVGVAIDAASRGYSVRLLEQSDFGKGTSSRSTKLVHGGVRYLKQGNVALVMHALKERGILRQNAPHLVRDLAFIVPNYDWWEAPFYGIGLKIYDLLAGRYGFGPSSMLSKQETLNLIPTLKTDGLLGGVIYHDGQFDDSRLLINMVRTAFDKGAALLNYAPVTALTKNSNGFISGAVFHDLEADREHEARAKVVINATGAFTDGVRTMDDPKAEPMIAPSQGVHIVLDKSFLPGDTSIMVPRTSDGRVMFAIPWHNTALIGTTDTAIEKCDLEPTPMSEEIDFILETTGQYLNKPPTRADIRSAFAGIRPLVKTGAGMSTATLSRDHTVHISGSGLLTITGGKWTTYRHMAEDCVDQAAMLADLEPRPCVTTKLKLHGYHQTPDKFGDLEVYGSDAEAILELMRANPALKERICPALPAKAGEVIWAVKYEMARTIDDILARRTRCLLLDARAAMEAAPVVARLMAAELGRDEVWQKEQVDSFRDLAQGYMPQQ